MRYPQAEHTLISRCESCGKTNRSLNGINDHKAEHTAIRCDPCELYDEQKGAKNSMKDHVVSEHILSEDSSRIFSNPSRSNNVTSGCPEDNKQ